MSRIVKSFVFCLGIVWVFPQVTLADKVSDKEELKNLLKNKDDIKKAVTKVQELLGEKTTFDKYLEKVQGWTGSVVKRGENAKTFNVENLEKEIDDLESFNVEWMTAYIKRRDDELFSRRGFELLKNIGRDNLDRFDESIEKIKKEKEKKRQERVRSQYLINATLGYANTPNDEGSVRFAGLLPESKITTLHLDTDQDRRCEEKGRIWFMEGNPEFEALSGGAGSLDGFVFKYGGDFVRASCSSLEDEVKDIISNLNNKGGKTNEEKELLDNLKRIQMHLQNELRVNFEDDDRVTRKLKEAFRPEWNWDNNEDIYGIKFGVGLESDRKFDKVNFIGEVGFVPMLNMGKNGYLSWIDYLYAPLWILQPLQFEGAKLGRNVEMNVFLQGGYKSEIANKQPGEDLDRGQRDESEEALNDPIFRLKVQGKTELKFTLIEKMTKDGDIANLVKYLFGATVEEDINYPLRLVADATGWQDFMNGETYHRVKTGLIFQYGKEKTLDLLYESGSGAPNFNQGEQFTANLHVRF